MNIQVVTRVPLLSVVQELVELRLGRVLRRLGQRVEQAAVTFEDQNGPRGGPDILCRIWLRLQPRGEINVSAIAASPGAALSEAAQRAGRCAESSVRRSWTARVRENRL
ncbi:MAG: hypothetical protein KA383_16290 [Phycisphaerae bacterium]|nr:hypothetical protein [Phycisphaerae bacterium]HPM83322.1 hypothetical protein [Candidatus Anammoximicrobium sp.]